MIKPVLKYYDIADGVLAFSSTRKGGVSKGNFGEFNINEFCGDDTASVVENKKALAAELCIGVKDIIMPHQVHKIECRTIAREFFDMPENIRKMLLEGVDCVLTDIKGLCIGVSTADCIPVLLYDDEHHAVAAVHAGWRGSLNRIAHRAVVEMCNVYKSNPSRIKAVIGPGISVENFEVGDEVYQQFQTVGFNMPLISRKYEKWHINLPECNHIQLREAGLKEENIMMSGICTFSCSEDYFSARKLGQHSGRIFSGIMISE
jgi:YfiH family protein